MEQTHLEVLLKDIHRKVEMIAEGYGLLDSKIDRVEANLSEKIADNTALIKFVAMDLSAKIAANGEKIAANSEKIMANSEKLDQVEARLSDAIAANSEKLAANSEKLDKLAFELEAHRNDTESHRRYLVAE